MDINDLRGITTVMALLAFVGVCAWAWSKGQKPSFSEAANQLFNPEEEAIHNRSLEETKQ